VSFVVLDTDQDEVIEVIAWRIIEAHNYSEKVAILWISALKHDSHKNSLEILRSLSDTDHLFHAGHIHHEINWLFGMNLTRAFTVLLNSQK
jgi:DNA topoisomerase-3